MSPAIYLLYFYLHLVAAALSTSETPVIRRLSLPTDDTRTVGDDVVSSSTTSMSASSTSILASSTSILASSILSSTTPITSPSSITSASTGQVPHYLQSTNSSSDSSTPTSPETTSPIITVEVINSMDDMMDSDSFAEPVPDETDIWSVLGVAWPLHVYILGVIFSLLALHSMVCVVMLGRRRHYLLSAGYFSSLHTLVAAMSVLRGVVLLIDAYNVKRTFPLFISYFLHSLAFPCLTSAFSTLLLALVQTTRTQLLPPSIQRARTLIISITLHFLISTGTELLVGFLHGPRLLLLLCQLLFVVWGLLLCGAYIFVFRRLYHAASRRRHFLHPPTSSSPPPPSTLSRALVITLATSVLGLVCSGLQAYAMLGVYNPLHPVSTLPDVWPWWSFQTSFRVCEVMMLALMSYVASQPLIRHLSTGHNDQRHQTLPCLPCCRRRSSTTMEVSVETSDGGKGSNDSSGGLLLPPPPPPPGGDKPVDTSSSRSSGYFEGKGSSSSSSQGSSRCSRPSSSVLFIDKGFIRIRPHADHLSEEMISASPPPPADHMTSPNEVFLPPSFLPSGQPMSKYSEFDLRYPSSIDLSTSIQEELNHRQIYAQVTQMSRCGSESNLKEGGGEEAVARLGCLTRKKLSASSLNAFLSSPPQQGYEKLGDNSDAEDGSSSSSMVSPKDTSSRPSSCVEPETSSGTVPYDSSASDTLPCNSSTSSDTVPYNSSTADPLPSTSSTSDPLPSTLSTSDPLPSTLSTSDPLPSTLSTSDPLPSTLSTSDPLPSTLSTSDPLPSTSSDTLPSNSSTCHKSNLITSPEDTRAQQVPSTSVNLFPKSSGSLRRGTKVAGALGRSNSRGAMPVSRTLQFLMSNISQDDDDDDGDEIGEESEC